MAVAEALHPGELATRLERAEAYLITILRRYGTRWISRLGYDAAMCEARLGAMKGLVAWILSDGPTGAGAARIQTYILRGVRFHFGRAVQWHVGPVRVNVRVYELDPESALGQCPLPGHLSDTLSADEAGTFAVTDGGPAAVDDADESAVRVARVLAVADACDPTGKFRRIISLRHGVPSGRPLTFSEIGKRYGVRRQAAHVRYHRAIKAVRAALGVHVDAAFELG